jgi:hypothetical protein
MTVELDPSADLTAGPVQFTSSKKIKFELAASSGSEGEKTLRVISAGGRSPQSLKFSVGK